MGEIPEPELAEILVKRCAIAPSYAAKLVAVMRELERRRQVCPCQYVEHYSIVMRLHEAGVQVACACTSCLQACSESPCVWLLIVETG